MWNPEAIAIKYVEGLRYKLSKREEEIAVLSPQRIEGISSETEMARATLALAYQGSALGLRRKLDRLTNPKLPSFVSPFRLSLYEFRKLRGAVAKTDSQNEQPHLIQEYTPRTLWERQERDNKQNVIREYIEGLKSEVKNTSSISQLFQLLLDGGLSASDHDSGLKRKRHQVSFRDLARYILKANQNLGNDNTFTEGTIRNIAGGKNEASLAVYYLLKQLGIITIEDITRYMNVTPLTNIQKTSADGIRYTNSTLTPTSNILKIPDAINLPDLLGRVKDNSASPGLNSRGESISFRDLTDYLIDKNTWYNSARGLDSGKSILTESALRNWMRGIIPQFSSLRAIAIGLAPQIDPQIVIEAAFRGFIPAKSK